MTYPRALISIGTVLVIHVIAVVFNLYYLYKWFDIPMHFLGGLVIGILGIAIWYQSVRGIDVNDGKFFGPLIGPLFVLGFVALVGIAWEWHEFFLDQSRSLAAMHQPSIGDTMGDFGLDLFGGLIALIMFWNGYAKH